MGAETVTAAGDRSADRVDRSRAEAARRLGQTVVAARRSAWTCGGERDHSTRLDSLVLHLPARGADCPAGGALLLDPAAGGETPDGLVVVVPRRIISALIDDRVAARVVPPSAGIAAVRRLAVALLTADVRLSEAQARLAGRALRELVTAALLPLSARGTRVAPRRTASLLDRLIAHVDAHPAAELDTATLCASLGCSRSALYRAAAPLGGVAALVTRQRLSAIHGRLSDPEERRPIASLARAYGFTDPAALSHAFRRRYGVTASTLRRERRGSEEPR